MKRLALALFLASLGRGQNPIGTNTTSINFIPGLSGLTVNALTKAATATTITNSIITDTGVNVGIGTASPGSKLDVANTGVADIHLSGTTWGQLENMTGNFYIDNNANADMVFRTNSGNERMRILNTGNVGIGTATPAYALDVSHGVGLSGTARFYDQTATTGSTLVTITPGAAQTTSSTVLSVGGAIAIPAIQASSGQRYVCITTTGVLVSSASACSGT